MCRYISLSLSIYIHIYMYNRNPLNEIRSAIDDSTDAQKQYSIKAPMSIPVVQTIR